MADQKLPHSFYQQPNVTLVARQLLGKVLCTRFESTPLTSGIIVETEAYCGRNDKACHANNGRRTARTETMYRAGGCAYVYLCYGIHHLFNVVTNIEDQADAILIRAVKPLDGKEKILQRRCTDAINPKLTAGPGRLTQALGITTALDGTPLTGDTLWIEDRGINFSDDAIITSKRIGVDYAEEDADLQWRFFAKGHNWVSNS